MRQLWLRGPAAWLYHSRMKSADQRKRLVVAVVAVDSGVGRAVMRGIAAAAARHGWTLESVNPTVLGGIDYSSCAQLFAAADGVVVRLRECCEGVLPYLKPEVPIVGMDIPRGADCGLWAVANPENTKIGALAAEELLSLGCTCHAVVSALPRLEWGDAREKGFVSRIRASGGEVRQYKPVADWKRGIVERDALARWLAALPRPFGLFARNDVIAGFALRACKAAGLSVPEDAAIIGADDDETLCIYSMPSLTSVRIDHEGGGRRAAEELAGLFGRPRPERPAVLRFGPAGVSHRASTDLSPRHADLRIVAGRDYIANNAHDPRLGVPDVAAAMGVSRRQAERLFAASGESIRQRIERTRLSRVETLLATTEDSVASVAAACGCSSQIYFSDRFRRRYGVAPGAWRKSHRR